MSLMTIRTMNGKYNQFRISKTDRLPPERSTMILWTGASLNCRGLHSAWAWSISCFVRNILSHHEVHHQHQDLVL